MKQNINIPPHEISKFKERLNQKKCFYLECESSKIIKAHSIQENGYLSYLADDINGQVEVYFLDDELEFDRNSNSMVSKQKTLRKLHHRGIAQASTFNGFCEEHDRIFKNAIEDVDFLGTPNQLFFHSYRAYAYFMHKKYELYKMVSGVVSELDKMLDLEELNQRIPLEDSSNEMFKSLNNILDRAQGMVGGLKSTFKLLSKESDKLLFELKLKKSRLDDIVEHKLFGKMEYITFKSNSIFPLATSSVVQYIDNIAQPSSDGVVYAAEFALTVFPEPKTSSTQIILGAFPENPNWQILKHKLNIMTEIDKLKFISDLLINRGNNIYLSPRVIKKMSKTEKENLVSLRSDKMNVDIGLPKIDINLFDVRFKDTISH